MYVHMYICIYICKCTYVYDVLYAVHKDEDEKSVSCRSEECLTPQKRATLGIARPKQQRKSCLSKHCCFFRVDYVKT